MHHSLKMDATVWIMGVLPLLALLASVILSLRIAWKSGQGYDLMICLGVLAGAAVSLWVLYRVFIIGAWPTSLLHLIIGGIVLAVAGQGSLYGLRSRRKHHQPSP